MIDNLDYNRISLNNALIKGDFYHAFEKINDNIEIIEENLSKLNDYCLRMGSKNDNKNITQNSNELIESLSKNFKDTFNFINDIKNYQYVNRNEKNENLKKAREIEINLNKSYNSFKTTLNKIQNNGKDILKINDYLNSSMNSNKDGSSINLNNNNKVELQLFSNEREYLDGVDEKEKQINYIKNITNEINDISKQQALIVTQTGEKIQTIEDNVNNMNLNIKNAVNHMKEAKKANEQVSSGYTNYLLYGVLLVVAVLIFLSLLIPD